MIPKQKTIWLVIYCDKKTGKQMGPTWEVPSKIKPTRWTKNAFPEGDYDISYENTGQTEDQYMEG